jgi:hypothetical protein
VPLCFVCLFLFLFRLRRRWLVERPDVSLKQLHILKCTNESDNLILFQTRNLSEIKIENDLKKKNVKNF